MVKLKLKNYVADFDGDNVAVVGDWHGDTFFSMRILRTLNHLGVKVVVSVGDFGFWKEDAIFFAQMTKFMKNNGMIMLFVDGNHENHKLLNSLPVNEVTGAHHVRKNIFHILRGSVFTISDEDGEYTWMGLGGAVSVDQDFRTPEVDWFAEEALTNEEVNKALEVGKVNVLVTHDAPHTNTLTNRYMTPGMSTWPVKYIVDSNGHQEKITKVMEALQPEFLYHGHHHYRYNEKMGYTDVIGLDCNGGQYMPNVMICGVDGVPNLEELRKLTPELVNEVATF